MGPLREGTSKPTYHYLYGSTADETPPSPQVSETDILFGEFLVGTDNEGETPNSSSRDLPQLLIWKDGDRSNGIDIPRGGELQTLAPNGRMKHINKPTTSIWCGSFPSFSCFDAKGTQRVLRIIVFMVMMILMIMLIVVLKPKRRVSMNGIGNNGGLAPIFRMPFPIVDRADYGDPASKIILPDLFDPILLFDATTSKGATSPSNAIPLLKVPFPTGAFWTNLVMAPDALGLSYPIVTYPYAFKWSNSLLQISYPAMRRMMDNISIRDVFEPDLTLGSVDTPYKRHVTKFDPLSVTLRFRTNENESESYWETYLVHGMPYVTTKYVKSRPVIKALSTFEKIFCSLDVSAVNMDDSESGNSVTSKWGPCFPTSVTSTPILSLKGQRFLIVTQENKKWIVFASETIEFSFDSRIRTQIVAATSFSGVLRFALIPPTSISPNGKAKVNDASTDLMQVFQSTGFKTLVYHSGVYPIGGKVSWEFSEANVVPSTSSSTWKTVKGISSSSSSNTARKRSIGTIRFQYETQKMSPSTKERLDLLMLGLPHHADVLDSDYILTDKVFDLQYWCIKGKMIPVVGTTWSYDEVLTDTQFDVSSDWNFNDAVIRHIQESIETDKYLFLTTKTLNIYGYGKQVARLAQLAHISQVIAKEANVTSQSGNEITKILYNSLADLFDGKIEDELVYDAKFGGIVSKNGLLNSDEDFGNGRYNDHHFHYGYILYAAAILGHLNATFVKQYKTQVDSLLYDIAYVGNIDSSIVDDGVFFPFTRYKSWYDGHSFAAGLFQQGNGKSQESTSEAINGYYGAYLWTLVKSNMLETDVSVEVRDFMRLLLATEIRGTKTYWQMTPPRMDQNVSKQDATPQRYDASFTRNYMVGNLGMLDAVCSTYFAKELFYVHLINVIPVTAITAEVFDKDYVTEQYKNVIAVSEIPSAWQGYAVCNEAMVDPNIAWGKAVTMLSSQMDSGLSKSQVLYFISSLPDFQPPNDVFDPKRASSNDNSGLSSSCESHPKCTSLIGLCCPTSAGNFLDCCNTSPELVDNHQNALPLSGDPFSSDNASCDSHSQCSGLRGDCCPTSGGKFLACCDASK